MGLCAVLLAVPLEAYRASEPWSIFGDLKVPSIFSDAKVPTKDRPKHEDVSVSIAERAEKQAADGVTIRYLSWHKDGQRPRPLVREMRRRTQNSIKGSRSWENGQWIRGEWKVTTDPDVPDWLLKEYNLTHRTLSRCGFTWDDAAAKVGPSCKKDLDCGRPKGSEATWPPTQPYRCYADLPDYQRGENGECMSKDTNQKSDLYCQITCGLVPGAWCDGAICECRKEGEAWDLTAPIQPHDDSKNPEDLPHMDHELRKLVREEWASVPSGLPTCRWQPHAGCTNESQYECVKGPRKGECSADNWFGSPECEASCVHVSVLSPAPYYALWNSGPAARSCRKLERVPRYRHNAKRLTPQKRGIDLHQSDMMMSRFCKSISNRFVGVTMYSSTYEEKAARLVRSCERVGVCCKAMMLPGGTFGPNAPEGSDAFRFEVIAMKPAFILTQLEATELPVVYLDTDLEFHRFPDLFLPGSWPEYDRDVVLFNFWGNETLPGTKDSPKIGSAVAFFNTTDRSKRLLTAWAEAMAWDGNARAPDDQVLDLLLSKEGGWLRRASFGWLPAAYLRTMPAYYRGIVPVIEHDHGSAPSIHEGQSKPKYPPIKDMELCNPDDPANKNAPLHVTEEGAQHELDCTIDDRQFCDMQVWNMIPEKAKSRQDAIQKVVAPDAWTHDQCKNCYFSEDEVAYCPKCGANHMLVPNCCSHGGAWEGQCSVDVDASDGGEHTWAEGYDACNVPAPTHENRRKSRHGQGRQKHYATRVKVLKGEPEFMRFSPDGRPLPAQSNAQHAHREEEMNFSKRSSYV